MLSLSHRLVASDAYNVDEIIVVAAVVIIVF